MNNPKKIANAYLAVWNDHDDAARHALMRQDWAEDAHYIDPMMSGDGRQGIAEMIKGARGQFPGHSFTLKGAPDGHGDHVRFSWALAPEGGDIVATGTDMVELNSDGRIARVVGFLGYAPI